MKRRYNINRIKEQRVYDFKMIAKCLGIHQRTIQSWHRKGLMCINERTQRYLVQGIELKRFLGEKQAARKCKLKADEFFCLMCNAATKAKPGSLSFEVTGKRVGKNSVQMIISGKCEKCGKSIYRFSTQNEGNEK